MSREDHRRHDVELEKQRELESTTRHSKNLKYTREFMYFVISMLLPWGYGEIELIPRANVWHVIVGWGLWALPVAIVSRIFWLWLESRGRSKESRAFLMVVIGFGFLLSANASVNAFVKRQMEEQQTDVEKNLKVDARLPPDGNPWGTLFSVTNGSNIALDFSFSCDVHIIVDGGGNRWGGPWEKRSVNRRLEPNGDTESNQCLTVISSDQPIVCADVELNFDYTLETRPAIFKKKRSRFVGYREGPNFQWYRRALEYKGTYCDKFPTPHLAP